MRIQIHKSGVEGRKEAMLNHGVGQKHIGPERENVWLGYGFSRYRDPGGQKNTVQGDIKDRGQGSKRKSSEHGLWGARQKEAQWTSRTHAEIKPSSSSKRVRNLLDLVT